MKSVSLIRLDKIPITIPLKEGENIIGRGDKIQCFDRRVSRRHCKLHVHPNGHIELTQLHPNCSYYSSKGLGMQRLASEKSILLNEGDNFSLLSDEYKFQIEVFTEESEPAAQEAVENAESVPATVVNEELPEFTNYESDASVKDNVSESSYDNAPVKRKSSTESSAKKIKTDLSDAAAISEAILAETVEAGLDLAEKENFGAVENTETLKDLVLENNAEPTHNDNQPVSESKQTDDPLPVSEGEVD